MIKLMKYIKPYLGGMLVGLLIKIIATVCELLVPMALSIVIDDIVPMKQIRLVYASGGVMLLLSFGALVGNITANRKASKVARDATERIRLDLYTKISYLSNKQAEYYTMPSLLSRATSDTYNIHQMLGMMQRLGVRAPIMLIGGICLAFSLDVFLTLVMIALIPVLVICIITISKYGIPLYTQIQKTNDKFVRVMREDITGIRVIKALSRVDYEKQRFNEYSYELVKKEQRANLFMNAMNPLCTFFLNVGIVGIVIVGAYRVNAGLLKPGTIVAFLSYVTMILNTILFLSRLFTIYSKADASGKRIVEILETEQDLIVEKRPPKITDALISFDHVTFGYEEGKTNLQNINFELYRGQTLGIIGPIGSGKSTIINLLMRFYDTNEGAIYLKGCDVRSLPLEELRRHFGAVFQNDVIFHDTLRENISFGRDLSEEAILKAVEYAQASEFIHEKGLDYVCGIHGADLSGGQKQRVLISRALAGNPEILVLDDSSSALDYGTDAKLREEIRLHFVKTTKIIIAQRVSSIKHADKILVLDRGEVRGIGTHEELMKNCELYCSIAASQMGDPRFQGGAADEQ
ncbi:MAG: ABC transporter ATP-binding protein [Lachnospiraceae bacterium]